MSDVQDCARVVHWAMVPSLTVVRWWTACAIEGVSPDDDDARPDLFEDKEAVVTCLKCLWQQDQDPNQFDKFKWFSAREKDNAIWR